MRFNDSPGLFGIGIGHGTCGDIKCDICGTKYNEGADKGEDYINFDSVTHQEFAGLTVCGCCFEKIEESVWRYRKDILTWYDKRIKAMQKSIESDRVIIDGIMPKTKN